MLLLTVEAGWRRRASRCIATSGVPKIPASIVRVPRPTFASPVFPNCTSERTESPTTLCAVSVRTTRTRSHAARFGKRARRCGQPANCAWEQLGQHGGRLRLRTILA